MNKKRGDSDDLPASSDSTSNFPNPPQSDVHVARGDLASTLAWRRVVGFQLVQTNLDGVFATDDEFRVRTWNRYLERLTGRQAVDALGQLLTELLPVASRSALERALGGQSVGSSPERWAIAATGQYGVFTVHYAPVRDEAGAVVGVLGLVRDVSDVSELEDRLLHTQKLDLAGRLAGGIAHDFNNLLTVIMGEVSLALASGSGDSRVSEPLREIRRCAEQATTLTRQLLAFARREQVTPTVFSLAELVTEGLHLLKRLVGDDVGLVTSFGSERAYVNADRAQLEQVLANLVVNARDATDYGGTITLAISRTTIDESDELSPILALGEYATLTIEDTGSGMSPDVRARLFEPFFTTKDRGRGTGLGLYLSYDVVQKHGGHIVVDSEPGRGTRVRVLLPHVQPVQLGAPRHDPPTPTGTETILVVEPDAPVRQVTARSLRASGYRVLEAEGNAEALHFVDRTGPVDLLLIAIAQPGPDALDLVGRLRAVCPGLKVLVSSGHAPEFAERRGLVPKGAELLTKPYSPRSLAERIRRLLDA